MKKLGVFLITLLLMLSLFSMIPFVKADLEVVDSYSEENYEDFFRIEALWDENKSATGQTFYVAASYAITQVKFYLRKIGSPTGNAHAVLYAITGTPGTDGTPTGSALATSEDFDVSTLTLSFQLITFTFNATEQYEMETDTHYCIIFENPTTGYAALNDCPFVGLDDTSPTHGGNQIWWDLQQWTGYSHRDTIFYVYGEKLPEEVDFELIEGLSFNETSVSMSYDAPTYPITVQILKPTNRTYPTATFPVEFTYATNGTDVIVGYDFWDITAGAFIYGDPQIYISPTTEILSNGKYTIHVGAENAEGYNATATRSFTVYVPTTEDHTLLFFGIGLIVSVMSLVFAIGSKKGLGVKR